VLVPLAWMASSRVRYVVYMSCFYMCILLTTFISFMCVIWRPYHPDNHLWVFRIMQALCKPWVHIKFDVRNKHLLTAIDGSCIIVANHQSSIDLLGMLPVWPFNGVTMAKKSLQYYGFFGLSASLSGSVFVDRFDIKDALKTMQTTVERIKSEKLKLWVFAEGTRNHDGGMLPFKKGGFHMAVQCQVPIVPVVYSSYYPFYSKPEMRVSMPGHVIMEVLPPISTIGLTAADVTDLSVNTRAAMLKCFDRISVEAAVVNKQLHDDAAKHE